MACPYLIYFDPPGGISLVGQSGNPEVGKVVAVLSMAGLVLFLIMAFSIREDEYVEPLLQEVLFSAFIFQLNVQNYLLMRIGRCI